MYFVSTYTQQLVEARKRQLFYSLMGGTITLSYEGVGFPLTLADLACSTSKMITNRFSPRDWQNQQKTSTTNTTSPYK